MSHIQTQTNCIENIPLPSWCPAFSDKKIDSKTNEELFCICKKPDSGELMVGCDGCYDWYHFKCVHIPEKFQHLIFKYYCPYCQAGITKASKNKSHNLNDKNFSTALCTQWKRKCRLPNCYEPCLEKSKYCSKQHGMLFMQTVMDKTTTNEEIVTAMTSRKTVSEFQNFGEDGFIKRDISKDIDITLYNELISNDNLLKDLNAIINDTQLKLPDLNQKLAKLQSYIDWINQVRLYLQSSDNETVNTVDPQQASTSQINTKKRKNNKRSGSKNSKHKKSTNICGYCQECIENGTTLSVEDFSNKYKTVMENNANSTEPQTLIDGICIKPRCIRHQDWVSMEFDRYNYQIESLEHNIERTKLLIDTRKECLNIQFFEQLKQKQLEQKVI
ncbi:hypothetical protein TBLA_0C01730 [Henningerozyma blattae CBS 6284]|uniref:PHD-type domain-containing protein n=1 Tax=Henningerozyma blattae (strain ATCC 34711 / CBS 6284 / DSM 70876 / NBRC 10599 / NRRL Y-10934 / UCD 77-7) TaxID=1071380 RepID=I2H0T5_HENB6|nr:hypothetical protein TBLA_0C01730 [Tetrapisispora blattae CBS 6284]CCH59987.1 hypothetical protein TBLA_0C01730 [Tetrapisispora blattae CBS 6284]